MTYTNATYYDPEVLIVKDNFHTFYNSDTFTVTNTDEISNIETPRTQMKQTPVKVKVVIFKKKFDEKENLQDLIKIFEDWITLKNKGDLSFEVSKIALSIDPNLIGIKYKVLDTVYIK